MAKNQHFLHSVMTSAKNVANVVGGKTARACDNCIRKRARWYCAADDAFLCQACDSSVHSANPLARRHERVRLKASSYKSPDGAAGDLNCAPSWHRGITKKARTPRHGKQSAFHRTPKVQDEPARNPFHLVPEVGSDEANSHDENEEQLLYRVPIFDPFVAELCSTPSPVTSAEAVTAAGASEIENKSSKGNESNVSVTKSNLGVENFHRFLPSDIELAEFAADVESLLGRGVENECIGMEELGLIDSKDESSVRSGKVKVEEEESTETAAAAATTSCKLEEDQMEIGREPFELNFDYESPATCEEMEKKVDLDVKQDMEDSEEVKGTNEGKKKILLRLDYEAVISAWAGHKSPWTNGDKPDFDPDESWPGYLGACGSEVHYGYGELAAFGCHPAAVADVGREARVSRYREKRRTRLFSKKIRYEVRKLNAEKRPRMKGRFVKRASFAAPTFPTLLGKSN